MNINERENTVLANKGMFLFRMNSMSRQRGSRLRGEELVSEIQVLQLLAEYVKQELQIFAIGKSWSYRMNDLIHR